MFHVDQACCCGWEDGQSEETGKAANSSKAAPMNSESSVSKCPLLGKNQAENFHFMGEFRNICHLDKPG